MSKNDIHLNRRHYRELLGGINSESVIHSGGWRGHDEPLDLGCDKHFKIYRGNNEFVNSESHINGIESFWSDAKRRLAKFNGIPKRLFIYI